MGAFSAALYQYAEGFTSDPSAIAREVSVSAAILIATDPHSVELALSEDVNPGAFGWINFLLPVPAVDTSTTTAPRTQVIRIAEPQTGPSPELQTTSLDAILWGEDIHWDGSDWTESPDGDLEASAGIENAKTAIQRRLLSEGLAWDDSYGLRPRRYVDAPSVTTSALRGEAQAQAVADDRVVAASAKLLTGSAGDAEATIQVDLSFFGGASDTVTAGVQNA